MILKEKFMSLKLCPFYDGSCLKNLCHAYSEGEFEKLHTNIAIYKVDGNYRISGKFANTKLNLGKLEDHKFSLQYTTWIDRGKGEQYKVDTIAGHFSYVGKARYGEEYELLPKYDHDFEDFARRFYDHEKYYEESKKFKGFMGFLRGFRHKKVSAIYDCMITTYTPYMKCHIIPD